MKNILYIFLVESAAYLPYSRKTDKFSQKKHTSPSGGIPANMRRNSLHTENFFRNLIKSNRNQIVFTIFRLIWSQTDVRSVSNYSKNGKYNLI